MQSEGTHILHGTWHELQTSKAIQRYVPVSAVIISVRDSSPASRNQLASRTSDLQLTAGYLQKEQSHLQIKFKHTITTKLECKH